MLKVTLKYIAYIATLRDRLKKKRDTSQPIKNDLLARASRAWSHKPSKRFDWIYVMSAPVAIGQNNYVSIGVVIHCSNTVYVLTPKESQPVDETTCYTCFDQTRHSFLMGFK